MAGGIPANRSAFSALLDPGLRKLFIETGEERSMEHSSVVNMPSMEWNPITDKQVSGLGQLISMPEGTRFPLDRPDMGNTKTHEAVPFGLAFEATYPAWEDELYGVFRKMTQLLKWSCRHHQEITAFGPLNNAFSTSFTGFVSGASLCSTAQTAFGTGGSTQANRPSPDVGLSQTAIQASLLRFEGLVNERGLPMMLMPSMLLIQQFNRFTAKELFGSGLKPYVANNEVNSLLDEDLTIQVIHYFPTSQQTQWFLLASKGVHDVNYWLRTSPIFDSFDDPWTKNAVFTVYLRDLGDFGKWQGVDGSTG